MITREEIEQIRTRVDILEVVSQYLTTHPSGKNFVALCPFHPDRTPSLTISRDKGLFHCFGCGEGGDVFKFLMRIERIDFPEAIRRLAVQAGVILQDSSSGGSAQLRELMERVTCHYERRLKGPEGRRAWEYLIRRGLTPETIKRFRLGYAPSGDDLLKAFPGSEEGLIRLGLVKEGERGRFSFFHNRVIFPIMSGQGEVVGFAGRALGGEEPKYLNTPSTPLFEKSRLLYGLPWARAAFKERGEALLVEGYMDVLMAHQHGFSQAVASMGTAFTSEQAQLLKRFIPKVLIAYDRDVAGREATLRGIRQLLSASLEVAIVLLPSGEDPDELLRRRGREAFEALLQQALPFHEFYIQALLEEHDPRHLSGQEQILASVYSFLEGLESPALRTQILKELSGSLDIPLEELLLRMKARHRKAIIPKTRKTPSWGVEEHLMSLLLHGRLPIKLVMRELSPEDFPKFGHTMEALFTLCQEQGIPERLEGEAGRKLLNSWLAYLTPEEQCELRALALSDHRDANSETAITQLIAQLRLKNVEGRLQSLKREIKEAEKRQDREAVFRLQQEQQEYHREHRQLLKRLGWQVAAVGRRGGNGSK